VLVKPTPAPLSVQNESAQRVLIVTHLASVQCNHKHGSVNRLQRGLVRATVAEQCLAVAGPLITIDGCEEGYVAGGAITITLGRVQSEDCLEHVLQLGNRQARAILRYDVRLEHAPRRGDDNDVAGVGTREASGKVLCWQPRRLSAVVDQQIRPFHRHTAVVEQTGTLVHAEWSCFAALGLHFLTDRQHTHTRRLPNNKPTTPKQPRDKLGSPSRTGQERS